MGRSVGLVAALRAAVLDSKDLRVFRRWYRTKPVATNARKAPPPKPTPRPIASLLLEPPSLLPDPTDALELGYGTPSMLQPSMPDDPTDAQVVPGAPVSTEAQTDTEAKEEVATSGPGVDAGPLALSIEPDVGVVGTGALVP